jgi:16S rRNA (guanine966-N2)-methyltransferase
VRITGGTACGQKITGPKRNNRSIRPTSDRVREALFNILGDTVSGSTVLDLFAGTGSFGLEALSRGAQSVVFVDKNQDSLQLIGKNLRATFSPPDARAFQLDLSKPNSLKMLRKQLSHSHLFSLVFIDPPYEKELAEELLNRVEDSQLLATNAMVIVEERQDQKLPAHANTLHLTDTRRYGETGLWFYSFKTSNLQSRPAEMKVTKTID